ncbi:MAG: hypothetical protein COB12_00175 [Flavobacterium sp.]|nr:MAG: hypothetical protein COB12_00175 [Flavobacterium sp.]
MKKLILSIAVVAMIVFTVTSCKSDAKKDAKEVTTEVEKEVKEVKEEVDKTMHEGEMAMAMYQCPMKCEEDKMYDKEGKCPKCNMDLKKMEKDTEGEHSEEGEEHKH